MPGERVTSQPDQGTKPYEQQSANLLDDLDRVLGNQTQRDLELASQEFATEYPAFSGRVEIDEEALDRVEEVLQVDTSRDLKKANRKFHREYPGL